MRWRCRAEGNDQHQTAGIPTGCNGNGSCHGDQDIGGRGVGHEGGHHDRDDCEHEHDEQAAGVAAQNLQDGVADDVTGTGFAQSVGNDQNTSDHPDGVDGDGVDGLLHGHAAGEGDDEQAGDGDQYI